MNLAPDPDVEPERDYTLNLNSTTSPHLPTSATRTVHDRAD